MVAAARAIIRHGLRRDAEPAKWRDTEVRAVKHRRFIGPRSKRSIRPISGRCPAGRRPLIPMIAGSRAGRADLLQHERHVRALGTARRRGRAVLLRRRSAGSGGLDRRPVDSPCRFDGHGPLFRIRVRCSCGDSRCADARTHRPRRRISRVEEGFSPQIAVAVDPGAREWWGRRRRPGQGHFCAETVPRPRWVPASAGTTSSCSPFVASPLRRSHPPYLPSSTLMPPRFQLSSFIPHCQRLWRNWQTR